MMLAESRTRLAFRYRELAEVRKPLDLPVYGLEHGLDLGEVENLRTEASRKLASVGLDEDDWLVWIALAAEAGYNYGGDEFWPVFEQTPGEWKPNDRRDQLRRWFRRFHTGFGGPAPVGRWSTHFTIISWPIANAILPRYLQNLFARLLYEFRHEVAQRAASKASEIGKFLERCDPHSSSRFSDFLQQIELTSQIVLALRDDDQATATPRIDPVLLRRIVSDLGKRRESGSYLREAQNVMRAGRIRFAGGFTGAVRSSIPNGDHDSIQPLRLAARRQTDGRALIGAMFPDVSASLNGAGIKPSALNNARLRVIGENERWSPAAAIFALSGRDRPLTRFPEANQAIVEFEGAAPNLAEFISSLCRIVERPCWILRRHADGLYREVLGGNIRTGQSYLILSRRPLAERDAEQAGLARCPASVANLQSYVLQPMEKVTQSVREALARLNIGTRLGVIVEPAGLNPHGNQDDGAIEWLSTEPLALHITADFPAFAYQVRLDGAVPQTVAAAGGEVIVSLELLEIGEHVIEISIPRPANGIDVHSSSLEPAQLRVSVSAPQPWPEAVRRKAGFRLIKTPQNATLDDVLGTRAVIGLLGPVGRQVSWSLETFDASGHSDESFIGESTPVSARPQAIAAALNRIATLHSDALDSAHRIDVVASIDELGRQALSFSHAVEPLRWKFDSARKVVRLIDETSHEKPVTVRRYDLATPLNPHKVELTAAVAGLAVEPPGSLFIAIYERFGHGLFVSDPSAVQLKSFKELGFEQDLSLDLDSAATLRALVHAMHRWHRYRGVGHLAGLRKTMTLNRMHEAIASILCGSEFVRLLRRENSAGLLRAQQQVGGSPGFGSRMRNFDWSSRLEEIASEFRRFATNYSIECDEQRCRDAVFLAFDPLSFRLGKSLEEDRARFEGLVTNRPLVRGAYLAKASTDFIRQTDTNAMAS